MHTYTANQLKMFFLLGVMFILLSPVLAQEKPNVIVFIADDAGWRDFGAYGNSSIKTDHIDQLAARGMKFNNAFLTTPQCSPTRTSLLSGQFAHTVRTEDLHEPLASSVRILPSYLQQGGYYTAILGKTHIGQSAMEQFNVFHRGDGNPIPEDFSKVLEDSGEKPFFAWYAFSDPHRIYQENTIPDPHDPAEVVVPPYLADTPETRKDLAMYYDEITRMDRNIGDVLELLEDANEADNTLVLFITDNGKPFTRAKGTLYDEGIKSPLIAVWPDNIEAGTENDALVSLIHLAPTILDAAGLEKDDEMYGKSLLPMLVGESVQPDKFVFAERNWHDCDEHMRSVRSDTFKLIFNAYTEWPLCTAADLAGSASHQSLLELKAAGKLNQNQMLVFQTPRPVIEFYDIKEDPYELNNLAYKVEYRPLIREHFGALSDWMEATDDFDPHYRRRYDNTDRVTGTMFYGGGRPEMYNVIEEGKDHLKRVRKRGY